MKLLVVDDQLQVAEIVARLATLNGWTAYSREDANGLAEFIRKEDIKVLMIDYMLGEQNGIEIASSLRADGFTLPIIVFSGLASEVPSARARELNVLAVLEKPLSVPELRRALNQARLLVEQAIP